MTKLKTLKELGCQQHMVPIGGKREQVADECLITVGDLKKEAIKWRDDMLDHIIDHKTTGFSVDDCRECIEKKARIEWIKMFFNITEEDLK